MSDLVGNTEDRFSQNEAHLAADKFQTVETPVIIFFFQITLRKHVHVLNTKFFTAVKKRFSDENVWCVYFIFFLKPEAVLTGIHNLCFRAKNVYPCKPQFFFVYISRTCYPGVTLG